MYRLTLIFCLVLSVKCQSIDSWNGITPLKSTRSEVEKLLGKPDPDNPAAHTVGYRNRDGRVLVVYSSGRCNELTGDNWRVPENTLIELLFYPTVMPKLGTLRLDISKFERHVDAEILDHAHYINERDGISLTVDTSNLSVEAFNYFPSSRSDALKCSPAKPPRN